MMTHGSVRVVRTGGALTWMLVGLAVIGISVMVVLAGARRASSADEPARFAGGTTAQELESLLAPATLPAPVSVAIVVEPGTVDYYDDTATFFALVERWRVVLTAIGARATVVPASRIDQAREADVILLASSPCVGAETRQALDEHLASGGGVALTWLAGVRDGGCRPVGWEMLTTLTGARRADTLRSSREAYVTVPAGGPVAFDVPPGSRLEVLVANHVALRHPGRDGYWSDWMLNPIPAGDEPLLDGAIVHAARGTGRVVYWGFDLSSVVKDDWNGKLASVLVRNSIAWAAGIPFGAIEPWPAGARAAAVIAQDVEDDFENGRHALDSLRAAGVPGTFFVVTDLARRHRDLVKRMAAHGEVGTHSADHALLGGLPEAAQRERLEVTQEHLRDILGRTAAGLRPPEEQFDIATLRSWAVNGGSYVFAANNARAASPELISLGSRSIVLLGRTSNDDFIYARRTTNPQPAVLAQEFIDSYEKTKAIGGLYLLSYHSQMLSTPALVPVVATVARTIADDRDVWLTTAGQVAEWWRGRHGLRVTVDRDGEGFIVRVANTGKSPLRDAVVVVALPHGVTPPTHVSEGALLPSGPDTMRLRIDEVAAGETRTIRLSRKSGARDAD